MIDQSYSERQLFEKAYERIISEFQIVLNLSVENTQKKLDKALKRNLEKNEVTNQKVQKVETQKDETESVSEEENPSLVAENEE